jgi:hypothetical protein
MIFIISIDMQTFDFEHCIFRTYQHLGIFCTMLHNSSRSPIWYNMRKNINVNFHTLGDCLISYNSMQNQIFIPLAGRKKTSLLFSNVMIL